MSISPSDASASRAAWCPRWSMSRFDFVIDSISCASTSSARRCSAKIPSQGVGAMAASSRSDGVSGQPELADRAGDRHRALELHPLDLAEDGLDLASGVREPPRPPRCEHELFLFEFEHEQLEELALAPQDVGYLAERHRHPLAIRPGLIGRNRPRYEGTGTCHASPAQARARRRSGGPEAARSRTGDEGRRSQPSS